MRWAAGANKPPVRVDAPLCVQAAFYTQQSGKRTIVHLLNEVNTTANRAIPENNPSQREETLPIVDIKVTFSDTEGHQCVSRARASAAGDQENGGRHRSDGPAAGGAFDGGFRVRISGGRGSRLIDRVDDISRNGLPMRADRWDRARAGPALVRGGGARSARKLRAAKLGKRVWHFAGAA